MQQVADGHDVEAIDQAIQAAKADPRPSLIMVRTIIGYGLPTRAGTAKAHGEPPGDDELNGAKEKLGWPTEPRFYIPDDALAFFRQAVTRGAELEAAWQTEVRGLPGRLPRAGRRAGTPPGRQAARRLGRRPARLPGRREGHRHPRLFRQGAQRPRRASCPS